MIKVGENLELSPNELIGQYVTPKRDAGYVAAFSVVIDALAVITHAMAFNSSPTMKFNSSQTLRFAGEEIPGTLSFEIRISEDDIFWSEWTDYRRGDYYCRYFELRLTMIRETLDVALACTRFNYLIDLPDVDEFSDEPVTISNADVGATVVFEKLFHITPVIAVDIESGSGIYYKVTNLDTTEFTVHLYDAAGTLRTGSFNWKAHGV